MLLLKWSGDREEAKTLRVRRIHDVVRTSPAQIAAFTRTISRARRHQPATEGKGSYRDEAFRWSGTVREGEILPADL
jgi:hypothetical protein